MLKMDSLFKPQWHDRICESFRYYNGTLSVPLINDMLEEDPEYLFDLFVNQQYIRSLKNLQNPALFFMKVAEKNGVFPKIYDMMPSSLKKDVEYHRTLLKFDGEGFRYFSVEVQSDFECLKHAVLSAPKSNLKYLDLTKANHDQILLEVLEQKGIVLNEINAGRYPNLARKILAKYGLEKQCIQIASKTWSYVFRNRANDLLFFSDEQLLSLLEINPFLILDYPPRLRIVNLSKMIIKNPELFKRAFVSEISNEDLLLCLSLMTEIKYIKYVSKEVLQRSKNQHGFLDQLKSQTPFFNNHEFLVELIDQEVEFFQVIDQKLKKDPEFNRLLFTKIPAAFSPINPLLKNDPNFIISLLKSIDAQSLGDLSNLRIKKKLFDLITMIHDILDLDPKYYQYLPDPLKSFEIFAYLALQKNPDFYLNLPSHLKRSQHFINLFKSHLDPNFSIQFNMPTPNHRLIHSQLDVQRTLDFKEKSKAPTLQSISLRKHNHQLLQELLIGPSFIKHDGSERSQVWFNTSKKNESNENENPSFINAFWGSYEPITIKFWESIVTPQLQSKYNFEMPIPEPQKDFFVKCSWLDAILFCNALSELSNLTPFYEIKPLQDPNLGNVKIVSYQINANGYHLPSLGQCEALLYVISQPYRYLPNISISEVNDLPTLAHYISSYSDIEWSQQSDQETIFNQEVISYDQIPYTILAKNTQRYGSQETSLSSMLNFRVVRSNFN
jgi:hypothetical protein